MNGYVRSIQGKEGRRRGREGIDGWKSPDDAHWREKGRKGKEKRGGDGRVELTQAIRGMQV